VSGKVFADHELPLKMVGFGHCFRREAGAQGQYNKGLYRVHQACIHLASALINSILCCSPVV
jgi:seryl-tRNA synthetase